MKERLLSTCSAKRESPGRQWRHRVKEEKKTDRAELEKCQNRKYVSWLNRKIISRQILAPLFSHKHFVWLAKHLISAGLQALSAAIALRQETKAPAQ